MIAKVTEADESGADGLGGTARSAPTPSPLASPPRSPLAADQRALVALEGAVSVCAIAGGIFLLTHPRTAMPLRYLHGTWFTSWRWPGVALLVLVGIAPGVAAVVTLRKAPIADLCHVLVGAGICAWILLEAGWVVVSPGLQIPFGLVGVAILVLGVRRLIPDDERGARALQAEAEEEVERADRVAAHPHDRTARAPDQPRDRRVD